MFFLCWCGRDWMWVSAKQQEAACQINWVLFRFSWCYSCIDSCKSQSCIGSLRPVYWALTVTRNPQCQLEINADGNERYFFPLCASARPRVPSPPFSPSCFYECFAASVMQMLKSLMSPWKLSAELCAKLPQSPREEIGVHSVPLSATLCVCLCTCMWID